MINNTKHTQGPWEISGNTLINVTGEPANIQVAIVNECRPSDAKLIAAAPDMYEALKGALPFIELYNGSASNLARSIQKALDKAKGKQS